MDPLLDLVRRLARYGVWFGGSLMVCAAFIIGIEVVIRKFFNMTIGGADELSSFALAIGSAWAFGFTMLDRAHVRIESLYVALPRFLGVLIDFVSHLLFTAVIAVFTWYSFTVFFDSVEMHARSQSPLGTPMAIPQCLWAVGMLFFLAIAVLLLLRSGQALVKGDLATVQRLIGPRTVKEEVEDELDQAVRRQRDGSPEATS